MSSRVQTTSRPIAAKPDTVKAATAQRHGEPPLATEIDERAQVFEGQRPGVAHHLPLRVVRLEVPLETIRTRLGSDLTTGRENDLRTFLRPGRCGEFHRCWDRAGPTRRSPGPYTRHFHPVRVRRRGAVSPKE